MISRYASLRQGLVGAWCPSLGASGFRLIDRSGYNNHGVLTGMDPGTDWVASGGKGALDCDGSNDQILCSRSSTNGILTGPMAISVWVYPRSVNTYQIAIAQDKDAGNREFTFGYGNTSGKLIYVNFNPSAVTIESSSAIMVTNTWQHIAARRINNAVFLYRNGVEVANGTDSKSYSGSIETTIGCRAFSGFLQTLDGQLDDVRIYNRALTPSEIQQLYTGGRGVGLMPERIKHRRKTTAAATNRRRRILIGASS